MGFRLGLYFRFEADRLGCMRFRCWVCKAKRSNYIQFGAGGGIGIRECKVCV